MGKYLGIRKKLAHMLSLSDAMFNSYSLERWNRQWRLRIFDWIRRWGASALRGRLEALSLRLGSSLAGKAKRTLRQYTKDRDALRTREREEGIQQVRYAKFTLVNDAITHIPFKEILSHPAVRDAFPTDRFYLDSVKISHPLAPNLGAILFNFTKESTCFDPFSPLTYSADPCPCARFTCTTQVKEHTCGLAHELSGLSTRTRDLLKLGAKAHPPHDLHDAREAIHNGVEHLISLFVSKKLHRNEFDEFASILSGKLLAAMACAPPSATSVDRKALTELRALKDVFVFLPIDKNGHDFGLVCKRLFRQHLSTTLTKNSAYVYLGSTFCYEDLYNRHRNFNDRFGWDTHRATPYLYPLLKLHKTPAKFRDISGVSKFQYIDESERPSGRPQASTTPAQKHLCTLLKAVKQEHIIHDKEATSANGLKRCWWIESTDDAALQIKQNHHRIAKRRVKSYDFTAMYTKLLQTAMTRRISSVIVGAFALFAARENVPLIEVRLIIPNKVDKPRAYFVPKDQHGQFKHCECQVFEILDVKDILTFCVENAYVNIGGHFFHQILGLPMGGNAAPDMADLYCYSVESEFIEKLIKLGLYDLAEQYTVVMRFIDDVFSPGVPPPPAWMYQMGYKATHKVPGDVDFMGLRARNEVRHRVTNDTVEITHRYIRLSMQDKRESFPYVPTKYATREQCASRHLGKGILTGRMVATARGCNNIPDLCLAVQKAIVQLRKRGHPRQALHNAVHKGAENLYKDYPHYQERILKSAKFALHCDTTSQDLKEKRSIWGNPLSTASEAVTEGFLRGDNSEVLYTEGLRKLIRLCSREAHSQDLGEEHSDLSLRPGIPDGFATYATSALLQLLLVSPWMKLPPPRTYYRRRPRLFRGHPTPSQLANTRSMLVKFRPTAVKYAEILKTADSDPHAYGVANFVDLLTGAYTVRVTAEMPWDPAWLLTTMFSDIAGDVYVDQAENTEYLSHFGFTVSNTHTCSLCGHSTEDTRHSPMLTIPPIEGSFNISPPPIKTNRTCPCTEAWTPLGRANPCLHDTCSKIVESAETLCFHVDRYDAEGSLNESDLPIPEDLTLGDRSYELLGAIVQTEGTTIHNATFSAIFTSCGRWQLACGKHTAPSTVDDPLLKKAYLVFYAYKECPVPESPLPHVPPDNDSSSSSSEDVWIRDAARQIVDKARNTISDTCEEACDRQYNDLNSHQHASSESCVGAEVEVEPTEERTSDNDLVIDEPHLSGETSMDDADTPMTLITRDDQDSTHHEFMDTTHVTPSGCDPISSPGKRRRKNNKGRCGVINPYAKRKRVHFSVMVPTATPDSDTIYIVRKKAFKSYGVKYRKPFQVVSFAPHVAVYDPMPEEQLQTEDCFPSLDVLLTCHCEPLAPQQRNRRYPKHPHPLLCYPYSRPPDTPDQHPRTPIPRPTLHPTGEGECPELLRDDVVFFLHPCTLFQLCPQEEQDTEHDWLGSDVILTNHDDPHLRGHAGTITDMITGQYVIQLPWNAAEQSNKSNNFIDYCFVKPHNLTWPTEPCPMHTPVDPDLQTPVTQRNYASPCASNDTHWSRKSLLFSSNVKSSRSGSLRDSMSPSILTRRLFPSPTPIRVSQRPSFGRPTARIAGRGRRMNPSLSALPPPRIPMILQTEQTELHRYTADEMKGQQTCPICHVSFKSDRGLIAHMAQRHADRWLTRKQQLI
eukprot:TRINITY_DN25_c3_g1_i3.p1 TRINITY_DN25_c3_g1~~TRINITY_DN25_c3_g1_i3.p1  ORF type:complete len:1682 (+),score=-300.97 TRINITY_DN25_c3_g1_i3:424-5469(+)